MPGIISLLKEATSADLTLLRGKAMECAGLIGEAVGVQVFAADALEIMQLFMNALVRINFIPFASLYFGACFFKWCFLFCFFNIAHGYGERYDV